MIVMNQGDLSEFRHLVSRKQKGRWNMNPEKEKLSGSMEMQLWKDEDEKRLIQLSAYLLASCILLRQK